MALDATIGGASSNAYADRAYADAFMSTQAATAAATWTAKSPTERDNALIQATQRLDVENFIGIASSNTQALQWPRAGAPNRRRGLYASDEMPKPIKDACCLLAYQVIVDPTLFDESKLNNFNSIKLGPLALEFKHPLKDANGRLPLPITRLIQHMLGGQGWGTTRLVRG